MVKPDEPLHDLVRWPADAPARFDDLVPLTRRPSLASLRLYADRRGSESHPGPRPGRRAHRQSGRVRPAPSTTRFNTGKGPCSELFFRRWVRRSCPPPCRCSPARPQRNTRDGVSGAAACVMSMMRIKGAFWRRRGIDSTSTASTCPGNRFSTAIRQGRDVGASAFKAIAQAQTFYRRRWRAWATASTAHGTDGRAASAAMLSRTTPAAWLAVSTIICPDVAGRARLRRSISNFSAADRFTSGPLVARIRGYGVKTWWPLSTPLLR